MAELRPLPFDQLFFRVREEPRVQQSIFDLPLRKCWRPSPSAKCDLSVDVHGHRAQTPLGPAAGPHAQLAQNVVLSWLGGARVIELKTVQILDRLEIPRPCIDAATIGFNVEWSQELTLEESLPEYVAGWMLIAILRALDPIGLGEAAAAAHPVFELSVGYDLKGLQHPRMREYLRACRDVAPIVDRLRMQLPPALRDLDFPSQMVSCVTLSTFHGCPGDEVEAIARYLLDEHGVDVIVKLNPTLLGYDGVCALLHDQMGYRELQPKRAAFDGDLGWDQALAMARRLDAHARSVGRSFGVKMTNTLVVENHKRYFPSEKDMYLSGPPLHVLAMQCVDRFRAALGAAVPISFSGGIDQHNFVDAVACDLVPVTTCTDLLRPGGYGRMSRYLENLEEACAAAGARDREELILARFGHGAAALASVLDEMAEEGERLAHLSPERREAAHRRWDELLHALPAALAHGGAALTAALDEERRRSPDLAPLLDGVRARAVAAAGILNTREVTARVTGDARYAAGKNGKPPRKVGSTLVLLDCLSCDKCVPVCPNDANFVLSTPKETIDCQDLVAAGGTVERRAAAPFVVGKPEQWANYADACNECGNCDVFCPEDGGPYVVKARFFGSRASFEKSPSLDGLLVEPEGEGDGEGLRIAARLGGRGYELRVGAGEAILDDGRLRARYDPATSALLSVEDRGGEGAEHVLAGAIFPTLRVLVRGALAGRLNPVSAAVRRGWPA